MPQAEIHVADYCNLNCRGCTHFSPIFEREIPEFDVRINDIMLLKKKIFEYCTLFNFGRGAFIES